MIKAIQCNPVELINALEEGSVLFYTYNTRAIDQRELDQLNYFQRAFDSVKRSIAI